MTRRGRVRNVDAPLRERRSRDTTRFAFHLAIANDRVCTELAFGRNVSISLRRVLWIGPPPAVDDLPLLEAAGMHAIAVSTVDEVPRDVEPPDLVVVAATDDRDRDLGSRVSEIALFPRASLLVALTATPDGVPLALASGADDALCQERRESELWARMMAWARTASRDRVRSALFSALQARLGAAEIATGDLRRDNARLRELAEVDESTGLETRYRFLSRVDDALIEVRREGYRVALIAIRVVEPNPSTHGDELRCVAEILKGVARVGAIAGRVSPRHFALLIPHMSEADTERRAGRLREQIQAQLGRAAPAPRALVGVTAFDPRDPDTTAASLLARAESALGAEIPRIDDA